MPLYAVAAAVADSPSPSDAPREDLTSAAKMRSALALSCAMAALTLHLTAAAASEVMMATYIHTQMRCNRLNPRVMRVSMVVLTVQSPWPLRHTRLRMQRFHARSARYSWTKSKCFMHLDLKMESTAARGDRAGGAS